MYFLVFEPYTAYCYLRHPVYWSAPLPFQLYYLFYLHARLELPPVYDLLVWPGMRNHSRRQLELPPVDGFLSGMSLELPLPVRRVCACVSSSSRQPPSVGRLSVSCMRAPDDGFLKDGKEPKDPLNDQLGCFTFRLPYVCSQPAAPCACRPSLPILNRFP